MLELVSLPMAEQAEQNHETHLGATLHVSDAKQPKTHCWASLITSRVALCPAARLYSVFRLMPSLHHSSIISRGGSRQQAAGSRLQHHQARLQSDSELPPTCWCCTATASRATYVSWGQQQSVP